MSTATPPTTVLLASSSALAALPEAGRAGSPGELAAVLDGRRGTEVVVLGAGLAIDLALELVRRYQGTRPEVGFVMERHHRTEADAAAALEAGVREVVVVGDLGGLAAAVARITDAAEVTDVVTVTGSDEVAAAGTQDTTATPGPLPDHYEDLDPGSGATPVGTTATAAVPVPSTDPGTDPGTDQADDRVPRGHVTTVFAAKGGAGVSMLCVNLAAALADGGRRSVVLVDLDLTLGDAAVLLSLPPGPSLADAVASGPGGLTVEEVDGLLTPHSPGLSALLAPARAAAAAAVTPALVVRVLDLLAESFDHVVVDTPTSLDATVTAATAASDTVLHVFTPDVPSVRHLLASLRTLQALGQPEKRSRVVLNRSGSQVGLAVEEVERMLGRPVAGHVPSSGDVPTSVNRGVPIVLSSPGHPVSRAVDAIATRELVRRGKTSAVDLRDVWPTPVRDRTTAAKGRVAEPPRRSWRPAAH